MISPTNQLVFVLLVWDQHLSCNEQRGLRDVRNLHGQALRWNQISETIVKGKNPCFSSGLITNLTW